MVSHPFDYKIQSDVFSTPEAKEIFSEERRFTRWLEFEAALAETQGELGIIPSRAAAEICRQARLEHLDLEAMTRDYQTSRNSLMPLIKTLRRACREGAGEFVHYGATTQDVLDTAQVLELRDILEIIFRELKVLDQTLGELAEKHAATPMIGRTHGQQALPITFGLKTAVWLSEVRRHLERLKQLAPRLITGQLSGAVGSMAALGPSAREVGRLTMKRLGLKPAAVTWHPSRDIIAEVSSFMAMLTATFEKIANEIFELGKTEICELREPAPKGAVSSSTMPHKRNPVICQRIAVMARQVRALNSTVIEAMTHEHERDGRAIWSEWLAVPQISIYTGSACHYINWVISRLEVRPDRMLDNLNLHAESVLSEWLLFKLAATLGKMQAQEILHKLIEDSAGSGVTIKDALSRDDRLKNLLSTEDLDFLSHPEHYIGLSREIVADLLEDIAQHRQSDQERLF